jgi:hypothetical protein
MQLESSETIAPDGALRSSSFDRAFSFSAEAKPTRT